MEEILRKLTDKNDKTAYEFAKQLGVESSESDKYLAMIPSFAELLQDKSSYVRTRAFILICNQARWANNGQLAAVFDQMCLLLNDPKPTVVRQCLSALHEVVLFRPAIICIILLVACVAFLVTRLIVNNNYIGVILVLAIVALSKLTDRFIRVNDKDETEE